MSGLPYRPCVGAALFDAQGWVLVARRRGLDAWQMPQGGIDAGEAPGDAVLREIGEELGTRAARIVGEHPEWLTYDLPPEIAGRALGGRYRGQRQRWFALRFEGEDKDIRLDLDPHPEFDAWRWTEIGELPGLAVWFKRPIYEVVARSFLPFAVPV